MTLQIPHVDTAVRRDRYHGPVSYSVVDHPGLVEASGVIAGENGGNQYTTQNPAAWIG